MSTNNLTASELLDENIELLGESANGFILMRLAMAEARTDVMDLIVTHGFDINVRNVHGLTVMHFVAGDGYVGVMRWLKKEKGLSINDGRTTAICLYILRLPPIALTFFFCCIPCLSLCLPEGVKFKYT